MSLLKLLIERVSNDPDVISERAKKMFIKGLKSDVYDRMNMKIDDNYALSLLDKHFDDDFEESIMNMVNSAITVDPTNGKYVDWIIGVYLNNIIRKHIQPSSAMFYVYEKYKEDLPKVQEYLELFHKYKDNKEIKEKDINQYDSLDELYDVVKPFKFQEDTYTVEDMERLADDRDYEADGTSEWRVIFPNSEKTACIFGVNTEWCTAWGEHSLNKDCQNRTSHYEAGLIIVINKNDPNEKYQFHFSSNQFKDKDDYSIDIAEFFKENEGVFEIILDKEGEIYNEDFVNDYIFDLIDDDLHTAPILDLPDWFLKEQLGQVFDNTHDSRLWYFMQIKDRIGNPIDLLIENDLLPESYKGYKYYDYLFLSENNEITDRLNNILLDNKTKYLYLNEPDSDVRNKILILTRN